MRNYSDYSAFIRTKTEAGESSNSRMRDSFLNKTSTDIDTLFPKKFYLDKLKEQMQATSVHGKSPKKGFTSYTSIEKAKPDANRYRKADSLLYKRQEMPKTYQKMYGGYGGTSTTIKNQFYH